MTRVNKIHAITVCKDEADVIGEMLRDARRWCDAIYVLDNGSSDGTWDVVLDAARSDNAIVPFRQDPRPFEDGIRALVYEEFKSRSEVGDWWCILDADEFYIDDPSVFLAKIPDAFSAVWSASFMYYFTDADLARYRADPVAFAETPIRERLRYYRCDWSEQRFFRFRPDAAWPPYATSPVDAGYVYPVRIWLKHFQYRSPEQIERRLQARYKVYVGKDRRVFPHEFHEGWVDHVLGGGTEHPLMLPPIDEMPSWEERVVPASGLDRDELDGRLVCDESRLPPLPTNVSLQLKTFVSALARRAAFYRYRVLSKRGRR